jgi:cobalt/nickel transport system permease protein
MNLLGHHHGHPDSPIHRLPAILKLGVALGIIVGTVLMPGERSAWFAGVAILLGAVVLLSRVSPLFLFQRLLMVSPFVLGVALVNVWRPGAGANWWIIALKSALCLLTVIVVSNTTPFSGILRVLRLVRVPGLLVTTIALMHRYLFVLAHELERMRRGRASRTYVRSRRFTWHTLATVAGQLFIRATERAERIYDAMCARGWE